MEHCIWQKQSRILYDKVEENGEVAYVPVYQELNDKRIQCSDCRFYLQEFELNNKDYTRQLELHNLRCCRRCIACQPNEKLRDPNQRQCRLDNCKVCYNVFPEVPDCYERCPNVPQ